MERWINDLSWRASATENQIKRKFEPDFDPQMTLLRTDETESGVYRSMDSVLGLHVRYVPRPPPEEFDLEEEKGPNITRRKKPAVNSKKK